LLFLLLFIFGLIWFLILAKRRKRDKDSDNIQSQ
jgi:preprotein translocase subunit YajC